MRVLIIEDEPEIAALEQDYLKINGFETVLASGGMQGLTLLGENEIHLVILDIMLPGIDGFETLRLIREKYDVPVIILSAKTEDIDKIRGLGLGADDYMQKPFSPNELVARVRAHLSRYERLTAREKPEPALFVRGLRIDKNSRQVFVNDTEKVLTNKEFDLLLFFVQNPNRVFDKEKLFEGIWGMDALGDSSTVVVHIRKLREKIEQDTQNPQFIETVWGAGYRLRM